MGRKTLNIDWKSVAGAAVKKRMLKMKKGDTGLFQCPVSKCLHVGFKSDRGLRKHVNVTHPWFFYFDEQPTINRNEVSLLERARRKSYTHNIPAFSLLEGTGKEFLDWVKTPCGGGKSKKQAVQVGRRAMKFLMISIGDTEVDQHVSDELIDCCLGSPQIVINFIKLATEEWNLSSSAALNYMKAINDLMDFRKANGVADDVLRSFVMTEVYIRRGKENLSKQKKLEYSRNLDLEQLICRKSWATVEEMERVIPYHAPKYQYILNLCQRADGNPTIGQLAFCTRFIATFLFLRVKCSRPMTYQYITLQMVDNAKVNGGYIDQTAFKTEAQYAFDTLILSTDVLQILDSYINTIRPKMNPKCNYLLLTTKGNQYTALGSAMSILVHQAIEKYVNPTRYRQIIESESAERLTPAEMDAVSKDQKHSSYVARRIYQKKLSRDVAAKGKSCMNKIVGTERENHNKEMALAVSCDYPLPETGPFEVSTSSRQCSTTDVEEILSIINSTSLSTKEEDENDPDSPEECIEASKGGTTKSISIEVPMVSSEEETVSHPSVDDASPISVSHAPKSSSSMVSSEEETVSHPAVDDASPISVSNTPKSSSSRSTRSSATQSQQSQSTVSKEMKEEMVENELASVQCQKRFCPREDNALREGVKKYGLGKWSVMLQDKSLLFAPSRTRDSLRMRAGTLGLSKKKTKSKRKSS